MEEEGVTAVTAVALAVETFLSQKEEEVTTYKKRSIYLM